MNKRKVKVRVTVDYEIEIEDYFEKESLEEYRNNGTWCANNVTQEIDKYVEGLEDNDCMCGKVKFEVLELEIKK